MLFDSEETLFKIPRNRLHIRANLVRQRRPSLFSLPAWCLMHDRVYYGFCVSSNGYEATQSFHPSFTIISAGPSQRSSHVLQHDAKQLHEDFPRSLFFGAAFGAASSAAAPSAAFPSAASLRLDVAFALCTGIWDFKFLITSTHV